MRLESLPLFLRAKDRPCPWDFGVLCVNVLPVPGWEVGLGDTVLIEVGMKLASKCKGFVEIHKTTPLSLFTGVCIKILVESFTHINLP